MLLKVIRLVLSTAGLLSFVCGLSVAFASGREHPEHPQKDQPEHSEAKKASSVTLEDVAQFIGAYVKKQSKEGVFKIKDSLAKKNLSLALDKVHRERLSQIGPDMFFVCADFQTKEGKV